jgi:hypothetical protein
MRAGKRTDSTPGDEGGNPTIRLRRDKVETVRDLAHWNNAELARRAGLDQSAVIRLLDGKLQLGRRSIAGLLSAARREFGPHVSFDDLFEVIDANGEVAPYDPDDGRGLAS